MKLKLLLGSGNKIAMFTIFFVIVYVILDYLFPYEFSFGDPPNLLKVISIVMLIPGISIWIWTVVLILKMVPKNELIKTGPYSLVKHPLYTNVAFLVLPWAGFLLNTWLGAAMGIIVYTGSRLFAPEEEKTLSQTFGKEWDEYCNKVKIPWL